MKPSPFAYVRAQSLDEAFALLARHGEGAKLLAGGQSLIATLNMRLSSPELVIDIGRLPGLSGIRVEPNRLHIGALTTHAEIERSAEIGARLPLLAAAAPYIAHPAIRNVGTFGGSLATADPAAEWPACCVALDAELVIASSSGTRRVKAASFFEGIYTTALRADEILLGADFPLAGAPRRAAFLELAMRRGDYAIVGVAALASASPGALSEVRLAYLGAGDTPRLARKAMAAAEGQSFSSGLATTCAEALAEDLEPSADLYSSAATKLHLARVLTGRALAALAA